MKRYEQTQLSKKINLFALLSTTGLSWKDVSYGNDMCDSVMAELPDGGNLQLWLPNSDVQDHDNEDINDFSLIRHNEEDEDINEKEIIGTIEEMIVAINALLSQIKRDEEIRAMKRQIERYSARIVELDDLNKSLLEALKELANDCKEHGYVPPSQFKAMQLVNKVN